MYIYIYMYVCVYIYIYIYIYTHTSVSRAPFVRMRRPRRGDAAAEGHLELSIYLRSIFTLRIVGPRIFEAGQRQPWQPQSQHSEISALRN